MSDGQCRVAVHNDGRTVDLALPSTVDVAQLLPSIVDIVRDRDSAGDGRWVLHRDGNQPIDDSLTLRQNGVHDGELLWLTADRPPPLRWTERDGCQVLAKAGTGGDRSRYACLVVSLAAACAGAWALVRFAQTSAGTPWFIGAGLSAVAFGAAVAGHRRAQASPISLACGLIAVLYAAVAGAVAIPAGHLTAHLLLASAAACSVCVLLQRLTSCATSTALITATLLVAVVSMAGVTWDLGPAAVGAALAALSLAVLGAAPRLTIAIARIAPAAGDSWEVDDRQATLAHTTLTGLVSGSAVAAVTGAALVAYGRLVSGSSAVSAVVFTAVVGVALMLQARTHIAPVRRGALAVSGSLCMTTAFTAAVLAVPQAAGWLSVSAAVAALGGLAPLLSPTVGPVAHRAADLPEYAALAAVIPLACWVGGVYGLVRDLALL